MKKLFFLGLLAVIVMTLPLLSACAQPAPTPTPTPAPAPKPSPAPSPAPAPKPTTEAWPPPGAKPMAEFVGAAKPGGGTSWVMTTGIATVYNKYASASGSKMTVEVIGGDAEITQGLVKSTINVVQGGNSQPWLMYIGQVPGAIGTKARVRSAWGGGGDGIVYVGVHTLAKSGIKKVADLKGKKVGAETPAWSSVKNITTGLLEANGMTPKDVTWLPFPSVAAATKELLEGRMDAYVYVVGATAKEIAASPGGLYLIPISQKEVDGINKLEPTIGAVTVKGSYSGSGVDTASFGEIRSMVVNWNMDDYTVYLFTKIIAEHPAEVKAIHSAMGGLVKDYINSPDFDFAFPFHPGFIRYLKEIGKWGDKEKAKQKVAIDREMKIFGDVPDLEKFKALGAY